MKNISNARSIIFSSAAVLTLVTALHATANTSARPRRQTTATANLKQFAGTWIATRKDVKFLVLDLRIENGKLAGNIQTASFTVDTEGTGEITEVTDATLTKPLP